MNFQSQLGTLRKQLDQALAVISDEDERPMLIRILLEHIIDKPWQEWVGRPEVLLTATQVAHVQLAVDRLLNKEPIQYILGTAHFYGRDFSVSPSVLIPRRETEELLVWVREHVKNMYHESMPVKILDIGCGSGCIAISIELELEMVGIPSKVTGIDISRDALDVATKNAEKLGANCNFVEANILECDKQTFSEYDILISNPPYVCEVERIEMEDKVLEHEPALALFVPNHNPLLFYKHIASLSTHWLKSRGQLFVEINERFGKEVALLFEEEGLSEVELRKDLQGKDRMIKATYKSKAI